MNLFFLLFKKNIRENNGVDYVLMIIITLLITLKGINFILLLPYILRQNINNILWENENERKYYFQFIERKIISVLIVKQLTLILGFNIILLIIQLISYLFKFTSINFDIEKNLIINIFLFLNFSIANFLFNANHNNPNLYKNILKWLLIQSINIIALFLIYISFLYIKSTNLTLLIWLFFTGTAYRYSFKVFMKKLEKE